ncbi:uncharacterized protein Dana_GF27690 [Drosophila ananassae]|uniref:Uncharacterized protein n=1 Tax=Drosophila ananassae TaxID=7217 RepID=A0A0P8YCZ5_DROAN|nr:uncharacterized protein Dana_GF27690 [Drosophila ananassae]
MGRERSRRTPPHQQPYSEIVSSDELFSFAVMQHVSDSNSNSNSNSQKHQQNPWETRRPPAMKN